MYYFRFPITHDKMITELLGQTIIRSSAQKTKDKKFLASSQRWTRNKTRGVCRGQEE